MIGWKFDLLFDFRKGRFFILFCIVYERCCGKKGGSCGEALPQRTLRGVL